MMCIKCIAYSEHANTLGGKRMINMVCCWIFASMRLRVRTWNVYVWVVCNLRKGSLCCFCFFLLFFRWKVKNEKENESKCEKYIDGGWWNNMIVSIYPSWLGLCIKLSYVISYCFLLFSVWERILQNNKDILVKKKELLRKRIIKRMWIEEKCKWVFLWWKKKWNVIITWVTCMHCTHGLCDNSVMLNLYFTC